MLYKLTNKDGKTQTRTPNETQWGENVTHRATGEQRALCTDGVIHCYDDSYLAVLMNPGQGDYDPLTMKMWECKGKVIVTDGTKSGCRQLTTIKEIPVPELDTETRVEIAIHLALQVYTKKSFRKWAVGWLDNTNRTSADAGAARAAARAAAEAAAWADAWAAAWADAGAAWAAWAAARAAARAAWVAAWADADNKNIIIETIYDVLENKNV